MYTPIPKSREVGQTRWSVSLTLLRYGNETFTYFNLKGKSIKSNEYNPAHPLDDEHSANNTFIPGCLRVVTVLEIIRMKKSLKIRLGRTWFYLLSHVSMQKEGGSPGM